MLERFGVVSISLFKRACCHAYVVFCAICVAFLVPASAWVYTQ